MEKERTVAILLWTLVILLIASPSLFILYAFIEDKHSYPSHDEIILPDPYEPQVFFTYEVVDEVNWTVEFTMRGPYDLMSENVTHTIHVGYNETMINVHEQIFTHDFPGPGNYTTILSIHDDRDDKKQEFKQILPLGKRTNRSPIPMIKDTAPSFIMSKQPVYFSAEGSYDEDGQVMFYYWDYCDGTHSNLSEGLNGFTTRMVTWHVYEDTNEYSAKLWVMDNEYCISPQPTEIKVRVLSD